MASRKQRRLKSLLRDLLKSPEGRHKLYAAVQHPLMVQEQLYNPCSLDLEAFGTRQYPYLKREHPKVELLPNDAFWEVVFSYAAKHKITRAKALLTLKEQPFDYSKNPPHPFAQRTP